MLRAYFILSLLTLVGSLAASQTQAAPRTFVASFGADANTASNCSVALPCRGFAAAQTVTDSGGEIIVLDSAGYGVITITKSISIIAPVGVYAGISVLPGNNGITIATPGVSVVLRGISINSQGGDNGITMTAGVSLVVDNCVISSFASSRLGIDSGRGISVVTDANVTVRDTALRNNVFGIFLEGGATAKISGTNLEGIVGRSTNIYVKNTSADITTSAAITSTTVSTGGIGIFAEALVASTANVRISVIRSTITNHSTVGIAAQSGGSAPAIVTVSETMVTKNGIGLFQTTPGAVLESLGNNTVRQNTNNTQGTITTVAPV